MSLTPHNGGVNSQSSVLFNTLCAAVLLLLITDHPLSAEAYRGSEGIDGDNATCSYLRNTIITAPNLVPPKFMVSSGDCCAFCAATEGCVAAVFSNYYCDLKNSSTPQTAAQGPTLIVPFAGPTPAPRPTLVTIIREVSCQESAQCDDTTDGSCRTTVFFNNTCRGNQLRICSANQNTIDASLFNNANGACSGAPVSSVSEQTGTCQYNQPNSTYYGHYCDVLLPPSPNQNVLRSQCQYNCMGNGGENCNQATFVTGQCTATNQLKGMYTVASCYSSFVVYSFFSTSDCSGEPADVVAEELNQCFAYSSLYAQNVCSSS